MVWGCVGCVGFGAATVLLIGLLIGLVATEPLLGLAVLVIVVVALRAGRRRPNGGR